MRTSPPHLVERYRKSGWWSDTRITDLFERSLAAHPDRLAVVDPPNREALTGAAAQRLSYAQLDERAWGFASRFEEAGLRRDDILVTQLPNIVDYVAVYLAAMRLGIILSPVPMQFRRHEIEQILGLTGSKHLLTVSQFKGVSCDEAVAGAAASGASVFVIENEGAGPARPLASATLSPPEKAALRDRAAGLGVTAEDVATICWTSGTEGLPKGVPRTHNHWLAISHAHFEGAGIREGDVLLNPFPLVNMAAIGGCFMSWLHAQGTLVLHHPLDLGVYLRQIAEERPSYAIAPPAVLNMLLADPNLLARTDLSSLRCIGSGSAPLDPEMIRGYYERFGIEIVNMFGSNEGMSLAAGIAEAPDPERRARFFPRFGRSDIEWRQKSSRAIETRLVDPDTGAEILGPGEPGEMQIRGATVFDGYFKAPDLTSAAFTEDGFFRTGDLFEIAPGDDLRYYRFVGRLKQLIIRGGVKIAPEELEAALATHPNILEAGAVGYRDPIMGERICAVVVPRNPEAGVTLESVQALFEAAGFAGFKRPEKLVLAKALPRNPVGKVVRSELARLAESPA